MNSPRRPLGSERPDPVEERLRREFIAELEKVEGSGHFAGRLRQRIEAEAAVPEVMRAKPDSGPYGFRRRRSLSIVFAGMAAALCLILLARFSGVGDAAKNSGAGELVLREDIKAEVVEPARPELNEQEAVEALKLVNLGLGQSVRSVGGFRDSLQKLLEPLQLEQLSDKSSSPSSKSRPRQAIDMKDEQLVAKITWQVLGLKP